MGLTRRRRRIAVLAVVLVGVAALCLLPGVQARGKAVAVLGESLGYPVPRPFARAVSVAQVDLGGVSGDLYRPGTPAPAVLLVPGAAPRGRDDPRVVRLARALTRAERTVFVPELSLYDGLFDPADLDRLATAVAALAGRADVTGDVALLGFSFGGSFALVAAADPRALGHVGVVATFGSYFDMVGMIQAASTGWSIVDGHRLRWQVPPQAEEVLRRVARVVTPAGERARLDQAFAGEAPPADLARGARAAYDLVTNTDPRRTFALAGALDPGGRRMLDRFSPAAVQPPLDVPVLAIHSRDDPAVPYAELARLRDGLPHARTYTLTSFRHVGPGEDRGLGVVRDLLTAWWFTGRLLAAQE